MIDYLMTCGGAWRWQEVDGSEGQAGRVLRAIDEQEGLAF